MNGEQIRMGGLMRCDIESIEQRTEPGHEGDIQQCVYTDSPDHRAVFRNGAWEWLRPEIPQLASSPG